MQPVKVNTTFEQCDYTNNPTQAIISLCMALVATQCRIATKYIENINFDTVLDTYDFIIVGAGSAGSIVASGLANENTNWNILLIEAGDTPPFESYVTPFSPNILRTHYDWKLEAANVEENVCGACANRKCMWSVGRMLGGSSALGIQLFQIGNENNYDQWAQMTQSSTWKWDSVRKYFEKLVDIIRPESFEKNNIGQYSEINRMRNLLIGAAKNLGYREITSLWDQIRGRVGYQRSYGMLRNGVRQSPASIFLNHDRNLHNLHILKKTTVTKILFDHTKASGVTIRQNSMAKTISTTKEIILSAGTFGTPKLLMLSGLGPHDHLKSLRIQTKIDMPAVGKNLQDHTKTILFYRVPNSNFTISKNQHFDSIYQYFMHQKGPLTSHGVTNIVGFINTDNRTAIEPNMKFLYSYKPINDPVGLPTLLRYYNFNSEILDQIFTVNKQSAIFTVMVNNLATKSTGGEVLLKSLNVNHNLKIKSNLNTHDEDLAVILKGIRYTQQLLQTKIMQDEFKFEPIRFNLEKCSSLMFDSDEYWKCYMKYFTIVAYNAVGTARMGRNLTNSVVSDQLKVHGVTGLRVVDGSVMPRIIAGYTDTSIMMIALKAVDMIKKHWTNNYYQNDEL